MLKTALGTLDLRLIPYLDFLFVAITWRSNGPRTPAFFRESTATFLSTIGRPALWKPCHQPLPTTPTLCFCDRWASGNPLQDEDPGRGVRQPRRIGVAGSHVVSMSAPGPLRFVFEREFIIRSVRRW